MATASSKPAGQDDDKPVVLAEEVREVHTQEEVDEADGTVRYADGTVRNAEEAENLTPLTVEEAEAAEKASASKTAEKKGT